MRFSTSPGVHPIGNDLHCKQQGSDYHTKFLIPNIVRSVGTHISVSSLCRDGLNINVDYYSLTIFNPASGKLVWTTKLKIFFLEYVSNLDIHTSSLRFSVNFTRAQLSLSRLVCGFKILCKTKWSMRHASTSSLDILSGSFLNDLYKIHQEITRKIPSNKNDENVSKVKSDIINSVTQTAMLDKSQGFSKLILAGCELWTLNVNHEMLFMIVNNAIKAINILPNK